MIPRVPFFLTSLKQEGGRACNPEGQTGETAGLLGLEQRISLLYERYFEYIKALLVYVNHDIPASMLLQELSLQDPET